jgi:hypothetical protein
MSIIPSLVPKLPVSPLALPPPALRIERSVSLHDCQAVVTERRLRFSYMYDTEDEDERNAGSTLTTGPFGPKSWVHLTPLLCRTGPAMAWQRHLHFHWVIAKPARLVLNRLRTQRAPCIRYTRAQARIRIALAACIPRYTGNGT